MCDIVRAGGGGGDAQAEADTGKDTRAGRARVGNRARRGGPVWERGGNRGGPGRGSEVGRAEGAGKGGNQGRPGRGSETGRADAARRDPRAPPGPRVPGSNPQVRSHSSVKTPEGRVPACGAGWGHISPPAPPPPSPPPTAPTPTPPPKPAPAPPPPRMAAAAAAAAARSSAAAA